MIAQNFILVALIAIIAMFVVSWFFKRSNHNDSQTSNGFWFDLFGHKPNNDHSNDNDAGDGGD